MRIAGDNQVSLEEFIAAGGTKDEFIQRDINGDGTIDLEEMRAHEVVLHQEEKYGLESSASPAAAEEEIEVAEAPVEEVCALLLPNVVLRPRYCILTASLTLSLTVLCSLIVLFSLCRRRRKKNTLV